MNGSKPPPPPDPVATAKAQTDSNKQTAITTQHMNMVDQSNPYGTQSYTQNGTWDNGDPRFSVNTTLSPQEQAKQEQQWEFDKLTNQLGIDQTKKLSGLLDKPVDLNNEATESRLMELGRARLDPLMNTRRASLTTRLYNQGAMPGTPAWDQAMKQFGQQENDAYNQLLLTGRGQATQEAIQQRNQPINEITALMSGGQVTPFNPINTPSANVAGTDIAGLTMDAYKYGPLAQYQAEQANKQAMMSGMFSLGSAALGGWGMNGFKTPKMG
jgi:hypothetical protein